MLETRESIFDGVHFIVPDHRSFYWPARKLEDFPTA